MDEAGAGGMKLATVTFLDYLGLKNSTPKGQGGIVYLNRPQNRSPQKDFLPEQPGFSDEAIEVNQNM